MAAATRQPAANQQTVNNPAQINEFEKFWKMNFVEKTLSYTLNSKPIWKSRYLQL